MRSSRLSYTFLLSFLATMLALQWWQQPQYPWQLWMSLSSAGGIALYAMLYRKIRHQAAMILAAMLGISFAFAAVAYTAHVATAATIDFYADGRQAEITGVIADQPDRRPGMTYYTVEADRLKKGTGSALRMHGRVLVADLNGWPRYDYGDRITAHGILSIPGTPQDQTYRHYLSRYGIFAVMNRASIRRTGAWNGSVLLAWLYHLKDAFEARIESLYPEPQASLLEGLLTGSRRGIPAHLTVDFQKTGLTHLIAISGSNVTILLAAVSAFLFWLPIRWRLAPSIVILAAFTLLVGASASVVRAAIMGVLGLFALQLGRPQTARLTALWTLFLMLAWNPLQLWYDAGFQLSFLALLGLIDIEPLLAPFFHGLPEYFGIRDALRLTIAAQIATVPWMLFLFAQLSLTAPVSNILAPPAVPYAMLLGFMSVIAGMLWFPLGQMTAAFASLLLQWIIGVASLLGSLPLGALQAKGTGAWFVVIYYVLLIGWMVMGNRHPKTSLKNAENQ